jgi:hypothetical protein
MTAPFFFESETTGLMFVRHRSPQSWYAFFGFRVRMQPQTTHAATAAKNIPSCAWCTRSPHTIQRNYTADGASSLALH